MYAPQRRFFAVMSVLAVLCCVLAAALGTLDLALGCVPALLILGLLLCGRYVGEERLIAARRAPAPVRRAPRRLPRPAPAWPLASLLARRPDLERGPPRLVVVTFG
jgi:hypothetical protein